MLNSQMVVVSDLHDYMPLGVAILIYGSFLNGVLFPGQVFMQKKAMELRYKESDLSAKFEYDFFQTKIFGRTALDLFAFLPLWILGFYAIISQNTPG